MQQFRPLQRFAIGIALALAITLGACSNDTPEQAVRQQVAALQAAIDARDAGDIEALLAGDFVGNEGMDRRGAKQLAAAVFLRHREVTAKVGPVSVYQIETGWRQVDGEWKLLTASWTPNL